MFFMYTLADVMGTEDIFEFELLKIAKRYRDAKVKLSLNNSKIKKPHFLDSYILLNE